MRPELQSDELGLLATIAVDPSIYDTETIFRAAYWFTDRFYVYLAKQSDGLITIELRAKSDAESDLARACADFCNSLIDFRVRRIVASETAGVRDALVTKAFAEGAKRSVDA